MPIWPARETIAEDLAFTVPGFRKNACCYLSDRGLNDSEVGETLGMPPEMVRHYGKRAGSDDRAPRGRPHDRGAKSHRCPGQPLRRRSPILAHFCEW